MKLPPLRTKAREAEAKPPRAEKPSRRGEAKPPRKAPKFELERGLENAEAFLSRPAVIATVQRGPRSAEVHRVVAELLDSHVAQGRRGLAICGATAAAGIVDVASSLAASISMHDRTVLLMDAQPPRAAVDGSPAHRGLDALLSEEAVELEDVIHKDVLPGLDLLSPGAALTADLLEGERFARLASNTLRLYDCTIVCAPPMNRSASALTIARNIGHALIVARASTTFYDDLVQMSQDLRKDGVNIVGSIMIEA